MVTDSNHEAEDTASGANDTSGNPFSGVGNLQINVDDGTQNFNETYHLSNSGAFNAEGFVIRETGIAKAPKDGQDSSRSSWGDAGYDDSGYGKNIRAEMLKLCVLGRGAGGIVYKSLTPTMRIVAVKNIPVYESDKKASNGKYHALTASKVLIAMARKLAKMYSRLTVLFFSFEFARYES